MIFGDIVYGLTLLTEDIHYWQHCVTLSDFLMHMFEIYLGDNFGHHLTWCQTEFTPSAKIATKIWSVPAFLS